jgi:hypothetical protein
MDRDIIRNFLDESYEQLAGKDAIMRAITEIETNLDAIEYGTQDLDASINEIKNLLKIIASEIDGSYRPGDSSYS